MSEDDKGKLKIRTNDYLAHIYGPPIVKVEDKVIDWVVDKTIDWFVDKAIDWVVDKTIDYTVQKTVEWGSETISSVGRGISSGISSVGRYIGNLFR